MLRPNLVYHADWSRDENKRWASKAVLKDAGHYAASAPRKVEAIASLISNIRIEIGQTGCAFFGLDFPIGIPAFYAQRAAIRSFKLLLPQLGKGEWENFYKVCNDASEISVHRPFYPEGRYKGRKTEDLFRALGASSMEPLLRACERGEGKRKKACSLFWTLGGNQVGKAAIIGWRDLLVPALRNDGTLKLWPFDGDLESLLVPGSLVVAETYPAECYGWFFRDSVVKSDLSSRKMAGGDLLSWAKAKGVVLHDDLNAEIQAGFISGDDAFDACVGLFGTLEVLLDNRASGEPDDLLVKSVEGWILGRAGNSERGAGNVSSLNPGTLQS
jgi:hypothetical protein